MVAAADHPMEFRTKRHMIAQTLFSSKLINLSECDNYKKRIPKVSPLETEYAEALSDSVLIIEEDREWNNTHRERPMEKQISPTYKQQRPVMVRIKLNTDQTKFRIPNGPVTPEKKVEGHGARVYDQQVAEVLKIKKTLEDESDSESVVCDLLTKLQSMGLSYQVLEETMIGKTITGLKKHPSNNVSQLARTLVKGWRRTADEWIKEQSKHVETTSQKVKPTNQHMNTETKLEGSENATKIGNGGVVESSEKLEATKRKLQEGYEKAEIMKKRRRIQVMELHEVTKQGLIPKDTPRMNYNRRRVYWRC